MFKKSFTAILLALACVSSCNASAIVKNPQFFLNYPGVAASDILRNKNDFLDRWFANSKRNLENKKKYGDEKYSEGSIDVILQLNLDAVEAWDSLVACNKNDAELARKKYFSANNLCEDDEQEGSLIQAKLKNLHENFLNIVMSMESGTNKIYKDFQVHPLFSQIYWEIMGFIESTPIKDKRFFDEPADKLLHPDFVYSKNNHLYSAKSNLAWIANIIEVDYSYNLEAGHCSKYGLWPNANILFTAKIGIEFLRYNEYGTNGFVINSLGYFNYSKPPSTFHSMPSCWEVGRKEVSSAVANLSPTWKVTDKKEALLPSLHYKIEDEHRKNAIAVIEKTILNIKLEYANLLKKYSNLPSR